MRRYTAVTWLFALALATDVACGHRSQAKAKPALTGHWRSEAPEPVPGQGGDTNYLMRTFSFHGQSWSIDFTLYDDEQLQAPLLSGHNEGRYFVSATADAQGLRPAEFAFERRSLTPRSAAFAQILTSAGCGSGPWVLGHAQSVAETGCLAARVFDITSCPREYDVVRVKEGKLFLGARPPDGSLCMPDRRPQPLGHPLILSGADRAR